MTFGRFPMAWEPRCSLSGHISLSTTRGLSDRRSPSRPADYHRVREILQATFLVFVLSLGGSAACNFSDWGVFVTESYDEAIQNLRNTLPTDYNLTVYLPDSTGMDTCCLDLQALLSLNRSLGHLHRNSVDPLQPLVTIVIQEITFIEACPVTEPADCQVTQWNSTHLLQTLLGNLQSFDAKYKSNGSCFSECVLHTCSPGQVKTALSTAASSTLASVIELGNITGGADQTPTTTAVPTSPDAVTNPPSPAGCTPPNGNLSSPASSTGSNPDPSAANGSATNLPNGVGATPPTTTHALNNASMVGSGSPAISTRGHGPGPASANASLTNGSNASPVNASQADGDGQSQATSMSVSLAVEGQALAATECLSEPVSTPRSRTATVVMVVSVFANVVLLGCILRKRRRQAAAQMTEMEPLSLVVVEQWSERQQSRS
ncbi:uncharacterized protein LOC144611413 [Rhinoraja longicauda]